MSVSLSEDGVIAGLTFINDKAREIPPRLNGEPRIHDRAIACVAAAADRPSRRLQRNNGAGSARGRKDVDVGCPLQVREAVVGMLGPGDFVG
ncbi:MAG: hypothetical protein R2708_27355 [Vicinamibacterales bacterium]